MNRNVLRRAVLPVSGSQWNDGFSGDSGPSLGGLCRGAMRPIEAFNAAVRYVRNTSIAVIALVAESYVCSTPLAGAE
jgi:hypothetical protein